VINSKMNTRKSISHSSSWHHPQQTAILPMNLKKWSLIIKHLRILRFMGAMRATRFPGSLIMDHIGPPGEGTLQEGGFVGM
jgi:hypothetical protein